MLVRVWAIALVVGLVLVACNGQDPPVAPSPSAAPAPAAGTLQPSDPSCESPCRGAPRTVGTFPVAAAPEASGLAAGRRNPHVLYVLDDGPGTTSVLAVRARGGRVLGRLEIPGFSGVDTESLAVAPCRPGRPATCLFIGDIGDNVAARDQIEVLRITEPPIDGRFDRMSVTADRVALRYPDRPQNAEALLVDEDGTIGIITKNARGRRRGQAHLYLHRGFSDGAMTHAGRVRLPPPAAPLVAAYLGNLVTGGDSRPGHVVLRTYDGLYEFAGDGGLAAFPSWPVTQLPAPVEPQGEAVAYGPDDCSLFTVSEESGAIAWLPCP